MTAAIVWAVALLVLAAVYLAGEINGRRAERRLGRRRVGRLNSEHAFDQVTLAGVGDELADNDRWSRKVRHLEVVR